MQSTATRTTRSNSASSVLDCNYYSDLDGFSGNKSNCALGNNPRGQDRPRTFDPSQLPCRGHCLLRQLRKRPLLPISIGRTAADSLSYNEVYCQCPFQSRPECDRNRPAQSRLSPDFGYTPTACVSEPGVSDIAHRLLPHARALAHA